MSDLAAIRAGLCPEEKQITCAERFGPHLHWACSRCKHKRPEDLSPYTMSLLGMRRLVRAGYPVKAADLNFSGWQDLGQLNDTLEAISADRRDRIILAALTRRF